MAGYVSGSYAAQGGFGTKSVTVAGLSGESNVVVWAFTVTTDSTPTTPTCDGTGMTQVGSTVSAGGAYASLYRYVLGSPSGNATVAVADDTQLALQAWATNATNQTTPEGTPVTGVSAAFDGPATLTLSPSAGGSSDLLLLAGWAGFAATAASASGGSTLLSAAAVYNDGGNIHAAYRAAPGSGAQDVSLAITPTGYNLTFFAVAAADVGGGGPTATPAGGRYRAIGAAR